MLQKYLDNYDLSIKVIYVLGTLGFSAGTAVMAMFPNVYVAMVTISTMGIVSMSISYCPYALLGHYHEIKEVRPSPGCWGRGGRKVALTQTAVHLCSQKPSAAAYPGQSLVPPALQASPAKRLLEALPAGSLPALLHGPLKHSHLP